MQLGTFTKRHITYRFLSFCPALMQPDLPLLPSHTLGIIALAGWKRVLQPQSEVITHSAFEVLDLQRSHVMPGDAQRLQYLFRSHSDSPGLAYAHRRVQVKP